MRKNCFGLIESDSYGRETRFEGKLEIFNKNINT